MTSRIAIVVLCATSTVLAIHRAVNAGSAPVPSCPLGSGNCTVNCSAYLPTRAPHNAGCPTSLFCGFESFNSTTVVCSSEAPCGVVFIGYGAHCCVPGDEKREPISCAVVPSITCCPGVGCCPSLAGRSLPAITLAFFLLVSVLNK